MDSRFTSRATLVKLRPIPPRHRPAPPLIDLEPVRVVYHLKKSDVVRTPPRSFYVFLLLGGGLLLGALLGAIVGCTV